MAIDIYLNFNGNCREVVEFYGDVFGLEAPQIMTFGDVPPDPNHPVPEEAKTLVMHTRLNISGSNVMFSDTFPGMSVTQGDNFSLSLVTKKREEIQSAYDKLKDGGKVKMELQKTFWTELYGSLVDKFGIEWQFNLGE